MLRRPPTFTATTIFLLALAGGHALAEKPPAPKPPSYQGADMCGTNFTKWYNYHADSKRKNYKPDQDYAFYRELYDCEVMARQSGVSSYFTRDPFEEERKAAKEAQAPKPAPVAVTAPTPDAAPAATPESTPTPAPTPKPDEKPYSVVHCPGKVGPDEPYGEDKTRQVPYECELVEISGSKRKVIVPLHTQQPVSPPPVATAAPAATKGGRTVQVNGQTYRLPRGATVSSGQQGGTASATHPVAPSGATPAAKPAAPTYRTECGPGSQLWGESRPPNNLFKTCKVYRTEGGKEALITLDTAPAASSATASTAAAPVASGTAVTSTGGTPTSSAVAALAARRRAAASTAAKPAKVAPSHVDRLTEAKHEKCKPLFDKYQSDYWAWRQPIEDAGNPPPPMSQNPSHVEDDYRAFEACEQTTTEEERAAALAAEERSKQEKDFWVVPRGHFAEKISEFERRRTKIGLRTYGQMTFRFLAGPSEKGRYAPPAGLCGNVGGTFFTYSRLRPFVEGGFCGSLDSAGLVSFNWAGGLEYKILEWLILDAGATGDHGLNDHLFLSTTNNRSVLLPHTNSYGAILRIGAQLFTPRVTTFAGFRFFDRGYSNDSVAGLVAKTGGAAEVTVGLRALIY